MLADDDAVTLRPVLWNVVRDAKGDEAALRKLLTPANQEQLIHLHRISVEIGAVSLKPHLWNVIESAAGDPAKLRRLLRVPPQNN